MVTTVKRGGMSADHCRLIVTAIGQLKGSKFRKEHVELLVEVRSLSSQSCVYGRYLKSLKPYTILYFFVLYRSPRNAAYL